MSEEKKRPLLIVDDEESVCTMLAYWAEKLWDYPVIIVNKGQDALEKLNEKPGVVLLDIMLPDISGIEVLKWIRSFDKNLPVIMLSAQASVEVALEALRTGAFDYFTKPIDRDRLKKTIENAIRGYELSEQVRQLENLLGEKYTFENIISVDPKMQDVFRLMRKAVPSTITVTIQGESGTGKELIARALHFNGPRKDKPFIVVNCAAIPHELLESELFGHEKGAFTGAHERKIGKFEAASGGTLFLDEIGDMDLALQAKILRAIQNREIQRVGGTETIAIDVRFISATNKDLLEEVKSGNFREDLYYRLSTFPIYLPPLRERKGDILALAEHFLTKYAPEMNPHVKSFTRAASVALTRYSWPGNVRELESAIERAVLLCESDRIDVEHLPFTVRGNISYRDTDAPDGDTKSASSTWEPTSPDDLMPLTDVKHAYVQKAYELCEGNVSEASKRLNISRATMYRILENKEG